jgi:hypothetical protein
MQGGLHRTELMNANGVADGVARMATEIDLYTRATGRSRTEVEKQLRESSMDQAYQNQLANLGQKRLGVELGINATNDRLGKGASDMLKTLVMTGGEVAIMTEDSKRAQIRTGNTLEDAMRNVYQTLMNSGLRGAELQIAMEKQFRDVANGSAAFAKDMGNTSGILYMAQNKYFSGQQEIERNQRLLSGRTNDQIRQNQVTLETNAKNGGRVAMSLANAEKMIRDFGNQIFAIAATIIEPVLPYLIQFGNYMIGVTGDLAKKVGPYIKEFVAYFQSTILPRLRAIGAWFGEQWDKLKDKKGEDFWAQLSTSIGEGFSNIWKAVEPVWISTIKPVMVSMWETITNYMKPYVIRMWEVISDEISGYIFNKTGMGTDIRKSGPERELRFAQEDATRLQALLLAERNKETPNQAVIKQYQLELEQLTDKMTKAIRGIMEYSGRSWLDRSAGMDTPGGKAIDFILGSNWRERFRREPSPPARMIGTYGATGKEAEPEDIVAQLHQGERVLSPSETASYNNMSQSINQLNSLTAQLLTAMRENNEISRRTLSATKSIGGDLFA